MKIDAFEMAEKLELLSDGLSVFSHRMLCKKSAAVIRGQHERIAELEAELVKAREVPEMPEPDAYMATFKPAGIDALHSVTGSSIEALKYSVPTDSVFTPLLKWSTVRAMFERNKG